MLKRYIYLFLIYTIYFGADAAVFLFTYVYSFLYFLSLFLKWCCLIFCLNATWPRYMAVHVWQTTGLLVRCLEKRELRTGVMGSKLTCQPHLLCKISNKVIFDLSLSFPVLVMMFRALHSHFAAVLSSCDAKGKHSTCCTFCRWKIKQRKMDSGVFIALSNDSITQGQWWSWQPEEKNRSELCVLL